MGTRVAVVGCGTVGATMVAALAASAAPGPHELVLVDRPEDRWRGRAYQVDTHAVLANGPMVGMSLYAHDPEHGVRWADERGLPVRPDGAGVHRFLPRPVFGDYLCDGVDEALGTLRRKGWRVTWVDGTATGVRRGGAAVEIDTPQRRVLADHAVLCPGGTPASDVYGLSGAPGYLGRPYPLRDTLAEVPDDADVTVLGTGMTATDVVVALDARGHRGRITLASRTGLLPSVRRNAAPVSLRALSRDAVAAAGSLTLADVLELARTEIGDAGDLDALAADVLEPPAPLARLRAQLRDAASPDRAAQILQRAVVESGQDVWLALGDTDRDAVLARHHARLWSFASPIPRSTGETLARLADAGRLRVLSGLDGVQRTGSGPALRFGRTSEPAGLVLDAVTAAGRDDPGPSEMLVRSAVADGTLVADPRGGVRIDPATSRVLDARGVADDRLYALGELTRGAYYFVSAVSVFTRRAAEIAAAIAAHDAAEAPTAA